MESSRPMGRFAGIRMRFRFRFGGNESKRERERPRANDVDRFLAEISATALEIHRVAHTHAYTHAHTPPIGRSTRTSFSDLQTKIAQRTTAGKQTFISCTLEFQRPAVIRESPRASFPFFSSSSSSVSFSLSLSYTPARSVPRVQ